VKIKQILAQPNFKLFSQVKYIKRFDDKKYIFHSEKPFIRFDKNKMVDLDYESKNEVKIKIPDFSSSVKVDEYNLYLNSKIVNSSKYSELNCERSNNSIDLFEHACEHFTMYDLDETFIGSYLLELKNNEHKLNTSISFRIFVDKPELEILKPEGCSDNACEYNKEFEFECNIKNQNSDHVNLTALSCKNWDDCYNQSNLMLYSDALYTTNITKGTVIYNAKIKSLINQSFIIYCEAKNPFGISKKISIVIPTDIQGGKIFSIKINKKVTEDPVVKVFEGDSFTIETVYSKKIFKEFKFNCSKECKHKEAINQSEYTNSRSISFDNVLPACNNATIELVHKNSNISRVIRGLNISKKKPKNDRLLLIYLLAGLILALSVTVIVFIVHQRIRNANFKVYIFKFLL
jgi:hypothetical protein